MKFSIAGTGNMAWFLGQRLTLSGHQCVGVYGRDPQKAAQLAAAVKTTAVDDPVDLSADTDIILLAVADTAIAALADQLRSTEAVIVHIAGSVSIDVLSKNKNYGMLWPVYSIASQQISADRHIPVAWEASSKPAASLIKNIIHAFSDEPFEAGVETRQWLHLAAVFSNNFVNHLLAVSNRICIQHDLPFAMLTPLLQQALGRALQEQPNLVQTGPAVRRDQETLVKHLHLLEPQPFLQAVYRVMTASIQEMNPVAEQEAANS